MKSKAHKPSLYHPWGYTTWRAIEKGKDNYWDYLHLQAKLNKLSPKGQLRLEWIIFYYTFGERNLSKTTKHFGIARKTLRVWLKRFDGKLIKSLEEKLKRPKQVRTWMVSQKEEDQVITLRKENMEFGGIFQALAVLTALGAILITKREYLLLLRSKKLI